MNATRRDNAMRKDYSATIGKNLKKLLQDRNLGCKELAMAIDMPYPTLIQLVHGNKIYAPSVSTMLPIAHFFEISIEQLMDAELFSKDISNTANNQFIQKQQKLALNPELFTSCSALATKVLSSAKSIVSAQLAFAFTQEIYYYASSKKMKTPDEGFANWYFETNIVGLSKD